MIRIAVVAFPPAWVGLLRCALGAGLLWFVLLLGRRRLPPRHLLPWLVVIAFLNNAVPFTFFAWGERTVPSNIAAVLNATTPIWTLLLSAAAYRLRTSKLGVVGVLLSFAGVLIVVVEHSGGARLPGGSSGALFGTLIISVAALSYAIATVVAKAKLKGIEPLGLAATQLTLATLMLLPVALVSGRPLAPSFASIAAVAVLGFAGSGIAYLLYYRLLEHVSATRLSAVTYLLPIWGLFWGALGGESIGWSACVGVAVTIAGLLLLNWRPNRSANPRRSDTAADC